YSGRLINPEPPASDSYEVYADAGKLYRINKTTYAEVVVDKNLRIMQSTDDDGHVVIPAV
ncbi:hypothetical protein, partial [Escherichia coli]|uniref:hypothetical protein n=1 Tax=Escherichia coli TaxID=562 RepID=UPI001BC87B06